MDKFQPLRDKHTNGANYDLSPEDVVNHLMEWDKQYGITLSEVAHDRVLVTFDRLPDDVMSLAKDIYEFCPDTIDQHFGCFKEAIDDFNETGEPVPQNMADLIDGVDLNDEAYGLELLRRSLLKSKRVALWWD